MNPEELARKNIDGQLAQAGWFVQDQAQMNLYAGHGVAVKAGLRRVGRLRQVVLRCAFEGRLE